MSSGQSSKVEVLWSPNKDDDFATYSNELKLYKFKVIYTKTFAQILIYSLACQTLHCTGRSGWRDYAQIAWGGSPASLLAIYTNHEKGYMYIYSPGSD